MRESELQFEHALSSVALIHDIRTVLTAAPDRRAEWSKEVASLLNRICEILKQTPNTYVPAEWWVIVSGLRVLASHVACLTIAQGGEGDLVAERTRCDVLVGELRRLLSSDALKLPDGTDSMRHSLLQTGQYDSDGLRALLLLIPLPTLYWVVSL